MELVDILLCLNHVVYKIAGVILLEPSSQFGRIHYNLNSSALFFDFIYHLGIVVTIFYLIGYKGRLFSILTYLFFYSLYVRSFHISDGGDNLLIVNMFFLLFANNTAYFSFDSKLNSLHGKGSKQSLIYKLSIIIHNFAVLFVLYNCVLFISSQECISLWEKCGKTERHFIISPR